MKRFSFFLSLLLTMLSLCSPAFAASTPKQTYPGNNITDFISLHVYSDYQFSSCDTEELFTISVDNQTNQAVIFPSKLQKSFLIVNTIFQIISTILLGLMVFLMFLLLFGSRFNIFGSCIRRFHKKPHKPNKPPCIDKDCNNKRDKDFDHTKEECNKNEDKNGYGKYHNNKCGKKYDPSIGYSLDCNNKSIFPYNHNYNKHNKLY